MNKAETRTPPRAPNEPPTMEDAVRRAGREAALTHAKLGYSIPTLRDGKVVWLTPAEVFALLGVDANGNAK
jgi:hypothetical protein